MEENVNSGASSGFGFEGRSDGEESKLDELSDSDNELDVEEPEFLYEATTETESDDEDMPSESPR